MTGSFYTPQKLIEYMAKYISGRITPRSILEPSAGDGRFVPAISIFDCPITAVELYKEKADALHMHCGEKCEIICADFLSYALETEKKYDFIIGNPPYISKKSLPECQRDLSLKLVEHFKLDEALFQNIWVSFILASLKVLSPNGSIFFVLPFEFLQVQYAERLREFLETKFNTIGIMPKLEYLNPPKYDQYPKYREYLRKVTVFSCAYCTISESESPGATFNIDHFRPQKEFPSLEASCENLRYTCPRCNSYKRSRWIQRTAGCIRDCKTCTTHVCKENIPRFIDTLKELPSEHIFLNEDDMLCAYSGSNPANYTIKYLRLNRAQLVKLRHTRRFMDSWLDDLLKKRERAVNRLNELEMQKQDFLSKEAPCNESTTDLHTGMLKTMYEMVTTLAEQTVLMIDEEIHKLNILMEKHSGSDEE